MSFCWDFLIGLMAVSKYPLPYVCIPPFLWEKLHFWFVFLGHKVYSISLANEYMTSIYKYAKFIIEYNVMQIIIFIFSPLVFVIISGYYVIIWLWVKKRDLW